MGFSGTRYRYEARHPVSGLLLDGNLRLIGPTWSRHVADNGTMEASVAVPDPAMDVTGGAERLGRLRAASNPLAAAWYVKNSRTGEYVWGGPVRSWSWNKSTGVLDVVAVEWRAALYKLPLTPYENGRDYLYSWTGVDQLQIARTIVDYAVSDAPGTPGFLFDAGQMSGRLRDFSFYGSELKSAGELLDSLSQREDGFEWSVEIVDVDGTPTPKLVTWYPARGSATVAVRLRSDTATQKGNLLEYGAVENNAEERYARFWATGAGQAPTVVLASDKDPNLAAGAYLRQEGSAAYSSVTNRDTVAAYARANRLFHASGQQTLEVAVPLGGDTVADVDTYEVGDRASLRLRDRWVDITLPAVRILSRTVDPDEGKATLLLDLADSELPIEG